MKLFILSLVLLLMTAKTSLSKEIRMTKMTEELLKEQLIEGCNFYKNFKDYYDLSLKTDKYKGTIDFAIEFYKYWYLLSESQEQKNLMAELIILSDFPGETFNSQKKLYFMGDAILTYCGNR